MISIGIKDQETLHQKGRNILIIKAGGGYSNADKRENTR